jgi:hypothetical protein
MKVIQHLRELSSVVSSFSKICKAINTAPNNYDVIRTYTSNIKVGFHTFYTYINEQLCKDDEQTIQKLMPLIRRATKQINYNGPTEDCVVYRGMQLNAQQRAYFKINTIFRFPGFTSTSKSQVLAEKFGNTLFQIHIYSGCLQVKDVANISHYPSEQEYLFSPYSLFEVTGKNGKSITIRAIDNRNNIGMKSLQLFSIEEPKTKNSNEDSTNIWQKCCSSNCILS